MTTSTSSFRTSDGVNIHTVSWLPESSSATVVIVHGLAEHSGRYAHVAARLNAAGCAVYSLDHRGHGKSDGLRAYFEDFDQPVNDLKQYIDTVKVAQPGRKLFIYGHSLGSLITLAYALRHGRDLAGLVISGTPLEVESSQPRALIQIGDLLNSMVPKMGITKLDSKGLTHDMAVVQAYDSDPLVYRGAVRVRMAHHIIQVSRMIKAQAAQLTMPLLLIHGEADPICPVAGSRTLHGAAGASDKTLKIYPGLFHEIHNEAQQGAVLDDVAAWLTARL
jgi:lysophospholipase